MFGPLVRMLFVDDDGPRALTATPLLQCQLRVFGVRPVATSSLSARTTVRGGQHELPSIWATPLACVLQHLMPSARKAAVTASPMAGSSRKNKVLRAKGRDLAAQPGQRLAPAQRHHRRAGIRASVREWCVARRAARWKSSRALFKPGIGGPPGLAPVATRQRSNITTRSPPSFKLTIRLQCP